MLTPASTQVDAAPRAVMWTVSQIAERDGISKQAISAAVKRLVPSGLTVERDAKGRIAAVNVAELDHLRGRFGDPSKAQRPVVAAQPPQGSAAAEGEQGSETLTEARRVGAWLENEQRRIALAKDRKDLLPAVGIADAAVRCAADIARIVDRLPNATDELANVVTRDGMHGLRTALKVLAQRLRTDIADVLAQIATDAPPIDPASEEQEEELALAEPPT